MATRAWVHPVTVSLRNDSTEQGGTIKLVIEDNVFDEGRGKFEHETDLQAGEQEHIFKREISNKGEVLPDPTVTVSVRDRLGLWRHSLMNMEGAVPKGALDVYLNLSYYTNEEDARFHYTVNKPVDTLEDLAIVVQLRGTDSKPLAEKRVARLGERPAALTFPLSGLAAGSYLVHAELIDKNGAVVEMQERALEKLPHPDTGSVVKVDRYNRCVLFNGEPFFPFTAVRSNGDFKTLKDVGFNCVWRWHGFGPAPREEGMSLRQVVEQDVLLNETRKYGLKVIDMPMRTRHPNEWFRRPDPSQMGKTYDRWKEEDVAVALDIMKEHPGMLAYAGFDEPGERDVYPGPRRNGDICAEMMDLYKEQDPYCLTFHNYAGRAPQEAKWKAGQDVYELYHGRMRGRKQAVIDRQNNLTAAGDHKPWWLMLWLGGGCGYVWPPELDRAGAYVGIVHGATGLHFWYTPLLHIDSQQGMVRLAKEIRELSPALLRRRPTQEVRRSGIDPEQAAVDAALVVMPDGAPLLLAVNNENYAVDVKCGLPWAEGDAALVDRFDGAAATKAQDGFSFRMKGMGARAFSVEGAHIDDLEADHVIEIHETHLRDVIAFPERVVRPSRNQVINSSFEYATKLREWPDSWQPSVYGDFYPRTYYRADEVRLIGTPESPWRQDAENPYDGRFCLRVEDGARQATTPFWIDRAFMKVKENEPYVFSIYMRGDRDGLPILVKVRDVGTATFKVSREWKRYVLRGRYETTVYGPTHGHTQVTVFFPPRSRGVVWLDALQLEHGNEPTAYTPDGYHVPGGDAANVQNNE